MIRTFGNRLEYVNGNGDLHREDGPAIEYTNGDLEWWVNGNRHREDGLPAVEYENRKEWWENGKRHREDGPAIISDGVVPSWFFKGEKLKGNKLKLHNRKRVIKRILENE